MTAVLLVLHDLHFHTASFGVISIYMSIEVVNVFECLVAIPALFGLLAILLRRVVNFGALL
jgi:hypothetical protein